MASQLSTGRESQTGQRCPQSCLSTCSSSCIQGSSSRDSPRFAFFIISPPPKKNRDFQTLMQCTSIGESTIYARCLSATHVGCRCVIAGEVLWSISCTARPQTISGILCAVWVCVVALSRATPRFHSKVRFAFLLFFFSSSSSCNQQLCAMSNGWCTHKRCSNTRMKVGGAKMQAKKKMQCNTKTCTLRDCDRRQIPKGKVFPLLKGSTKQWKRWQGRERNLQSSRWSQEADLWWLLFSLKCHIWFFTGANCWNQSGINNYDYSKSIRQWPMGLRLSPEGFV